MLTAMPRRSPRHELDTWLDSHGYQHAHARKQKTPHPYAVSPRMNHAARKQSQTGAYAASGRQLLKDLATLSVRARQEANTTLLELVTRASKGDPGALIELRPALAELHARKDHATRTIKISSKDPSGLTAGSINKELDKLEEQNSKLGQLMIDAGRGYERPSEYLNMSDPLALELQQNYDRRNKLRAEIERRYGPGAPRRLPPGRFFGPLKSSHASRKQQPGPKYSPSDAVRAVLRRGLNTYDTPTEIKLNMSLLRNALSKCVPGNEILVDTLTDKIKELSMGLARMHNPARTHNHAAKAGVSRTKPVTIVVAWTEDTQELAPGQKAWRHDLGERPKLVDVKKPHATVWTNRGTPADLTKAYEYSRKTNPETGRVMVYPTTEKDPLGRARKDVLEGRGSP